MVRKRRRVDHTEDWQELLPLFRWLEQRSTSAYANPCPSGTPSSNAPRRPVCPSQRSGAEWSVSRRLAWRACFVTDSGSVFLVNRARAIYRALGIRKVEIEKGSPWQSYLETAFNVQRRMADYCFAATEDWAGLTREHDRWMHDYKVQEHHAHQERKEGRRSPSEVLSCVKGVRYREEDLARAFFSARHTRTLDDLVLQRFRLYAEEELARKEVAVWVQDGSLTVEYGGEALSRYEVEYDPAIGGGSVGHLKGVKSHSLFETSAALAARPLRLFDLAETLGEEGWIKVLKLDE